MTRGAAASAGPDASFGVRVAEASDAAAIAAIYAPVVLETAISFEVEAPDAEAMARRIADTLPRLPWLVCAGGGRVVGYACATPYRARAAYRWSVDVAVYVDEAARRRGAARALYTALLAILTLQRFHRAYAGITLPNPASVALHEALGFTRLCVYQAVGFKLGAWRDVGWWERPLTPAAATPPEPTPFARLRSDPSVARVLAAAAVAPT